MGLTGTHAIGDPGHVADENLRDLGINASAKYKGAWLANTAYAANDEVTNAYGLYVATAALPANLGAPSAGAVVATSVTQIGATDAVTPATAYFGAFSSGASAAYSPFTVNANTTVGAISVMFKAAGILNATVGIATAPGANPTAVTWLGSPATYNAATTAGQTVTVTLPTAVNLVAGTTYYLAVVGASNATATITNLALHNVSAVSGAVASVSAAFYGTGGATAWGSDTSYLAFKLLSAATQLAWAKVASLNGDQRTILAKTAAYTLAAGERLLLANGTFTVTLPSVSGQAGVIYTVKNTGTGTITITPASGTLDGAASKTLTVQYSSMDVVSDGTNWFTV